MQQMSNIIRIEEGGVSSPYIVYERLGEAAKPTLRDGLKLVREQNRNVANLLICEQIADAVWSDIDETPPELPPPETARTGSNE